MSEHNINQSDKNDSDKQKTERRPALVRLGKAKALLQGGMGSKYDGTANTYSQNGAPS